MDSLNPVAAPSLEVEREIATDLVRRAMFVAPALILVAGLARGLDGVFAVVAAIAVVAGNFALAAAGQVFAVRTGRPAVIAANALGGFALRMGIVLLALVALRNASFIHFGIFAVGVAVSHLGLLFWEMRSVSATLAFPGLKPRPAHD